MKTSSLIRSLAAVGCLAALPAAAHAEWSVGVSVSFAPPPLPVYVQPACPAAGYIWTPGYWAYAAEDGDYYWVPGTWVYAPSPGLLWTPGYWAAEQAVYVWHPGYWGPHVGYYGGVNYGFGYFGMGFVGGYWHGRDFYYNRATANVEHVRITNVYNNTTVVHNYYGPRPSYNGPHGAHARPTRSELVAQHEPHRDWTREQRLHATDAHAVPALLASTNHGRPPIAATSRAGVFEGRGVVPARASRADPVAAHRGFVGEGPHGHDAPVPDARERYARASAPAPDVRSEPSAHAVQARSDRPAWAATGRTTVAGAAPARWTPAPAAPPARPWVAGSGPAAPGPRVHGYEDARHATAVAPASQPATGAWVRGGPAEQVSREARGARPQAYTAPAPSHAEPQPQPRYAAPGPRLDAPRATPGPRNGGGEGRRGEQQRR